MVDDGERVLNLVGVALAAVIVVSVAAIGLSSLSAQQPENVPDADWSLTRVNDSHVRIAHDGGEPVATANVTVAVDGRPRHPAWTARTLVEGEYGVVRADANARVTLFLEREAAKRRVLARWDAGDAG